MGRYSRYMMENFRDEIEDIERDIRASRDARRGGFDCSDGYCGAMDCRRCRPGCDTMIECEHCGEEFWSESEGDTFCCEACSVNFTILRELASAGENP